MRIGENFWRDNLVGGILFLSRKWVRFLGIEFEFGGRNLLWGKIDTDLGIAAIPIQIGRAHV